MIPQKFLIRFLLTLALTPAVLAEPTAPLAVASTGPGNRTILTATPPERTVLFVAPDHADWTYALGETATFRVTVKADPFPAGGVTIKYRLGPEMLGGEEKSAVVSAEGLSIAGGTMKEPGFLRCTITATVDGKPVTALATAGFAPEAIQPTQTEPADFDAFWTAQKAALAKVPAEPELMPLPDLSTPGVEVFLWSAQNVGNWQGPSRFYGILAVPRGPGPFPAVLAVPGAGVRPYRGQIALAEKGVITLEVGIHGIPVNLPPLVYEQLARGALADYNRASLDDRNRYYYRRVYLGCLRANDYLAAHPKWDGKNLFVRGGSQGGQLAIVTAALDPRVTGLTANYPAYSDVTGYLHGRPGGWPGFFRPDSNGLQKLPASDPQLITTSYYDAVNFARRLKVPGFYAWGYNDVTCPPTSTFAAYNVITAPKQLLIVPEQGHTLAPVQTDRSTAWVVTQFGLK